MYQDTDTDDIGFHSPVFVLSNLSGPTQEASPPKDDSVVTPDPLSGEILRTACDALASQPRITIKDVVDIFEAKGLQVGESAIRDRIATLVEAGKLHCLPGAGRRPSYYSLPQVDTLEGVSPDDATALEQLINIETSLKDEINSLEQQILAKRSALESIEQDIDALKRVIQVKTKLESGYFGGQD
jgi:hypothetical protein